MQRREFLQTGTAALAALGDFHLTGLQNLKLITRGDDLGCARSLNRAIKECYEKGILRNCSVLAASPYVEEAAKLLSRTKGICFGLHCDLTSEWDNVKWKPVSPRDRVSSLVDQNGHLHQTNDAVKANAKADEALVELQAQLDRARGLGFDIRYADLHMGTVSVVPGLPDRFGSWCRSQGIIDTRGIGKRIPNLPNAYNNPGRKRAGDYVEDLIAALKSAPDGEYLIVHHPAYNDAETRNLGHPGYPGDSVAHNLNWERLGYSDPRIVRFVRENGIQLVRYDETEAARQQKTEFLRLPAGFTPLFNGMDLRGWHISETNHHGNTKAWRVENSVIVGGQEPEGNGGILLTDARYRDFEVSVEIKPDFGCDGGLFLRSSEKGEAYQVMLDHLDGGSIGGIYGEKLKVGDKVGARLQEPNQITDAWKKVWKKDEWNAMRARITGEKPRITVWLNGTEINDFTDTENRVAGGAREGMIAVQVHRSNETTKRWIKGGAHRFRNFGVKKL